ncbi:MAG: hypothetical protein ACRESJ_08475 [Pseudomonas sp.]|uniref:hypothetical protein n=1 Tax=Pseudomonas sp. TaxID=306 RepID=UPI003D6FFE92
MKDSKLREAFTSEALFTKELLGYGATQIRRANYATQGLYFQSFNNLSIGLERIGKICLILDFFVRTKGTFPTDEYLRKTIGHDLIKIYEKSQEIIKERTFELKSGSTFSNPIHYNIMKVLSDFANGQRYSNINLLLGNKQQSGPIATWYKKVDVPIFKNEVSQRKKSQIRLDAKEMERELGSFSAVHYISEDGSIINTLEDASYRTGAFEAVAPKRQLYVLQIIRYWVELLLSLELLSMEIDQRLTPDFDEIFGGLRNDDAYMKTRKTWDKD